MLHYIHVILPLCVHLRMKELFQYERNKTSYPKYFMTSYQTLSGNCFLIRKFDFHPLREFYIVLNVLIIFPVISLIGVS